ncbi:MAG: ATP-binding protein [Chloroflexi bacterium]|nr:ATP-binding protein [Chloroflexota bacterium]
MKESATLAVHNAVGVGDVGELLQELRNNNFAWALGSMIPIGLIFVAVAQTQSDPLPLYGLFLMHWGLLFVAWRLQKVCYLAACWTLVIGCLLIVRLLVTWAGFWPAIYLLGLPAGLAALTVSLPGGVLVALALTLLTFSAPGALTPLDMAERAALTASIWGIVWLVWLTTRPLLTTLHWSWSAYREGQRALEETVNSRLQLNQTLEDLAEANLQLTRLNQLAQGLRHAAEEARRTKEQFVARVSHELRTPLNMIIGFCEMIIKAPQTYASNLPAALLADLTVVYRNSQHLSRLIDDVLDLSQIETGHMPLVKERASLRDIVDSATIAVQPLFKSKGLYLRAECPEDLPAIFCDPTRIREVMLNLLSNAGRFTQRGGVVVRAWHDGNDVVVSVTDTGPGISAADKERIFRPFEQLDGSIRRRHGGSGLGLSISKGFVELHEGRLWLESELGAGTTFFFRLPIDPSPVTVGGPSRWLASDWDYRQRTRPSLAPSPDVRPRLVVVESGPTLPRLLGRYTEGKEIVAVSSLAEAVDELEKAPAQALLVNAASLVLAWRQLQESVRLPVGTPVIVCSVPGVDNASHVLGAAQYLIKPVSQEQLLTALDQLHIVGNKILVIDDEPEASRLYLRMLAGAGRGYQILRATDGQQALGILRTQQPDAVLLDLVMPDMDGFRFLEAKNQDPALCAIPVVVISARDPDDQPIIASTLAVTQEGGLSMAQFLACVDALCQILSPGASPVDRAPPVTPSG